MGLINSHIWTAEEQLILNNFLNEKQLSDQYSSSTGSIIWASILGREDVVRLLLMDPDVNPAAQNNLAIQWASSQNRINVIYELLKDPRVDVNVAIEKQPWKKPYVKEVMDILVFFKDIPNILRRKVIEENITDLKDIKNLNTLNLFD